MDLQDLKISIKADALPMTDALYTAMESLGGEYAAEADQYRFTHARDITPFEGRPLLNLVRI